MACTTPCNCCKGACCTAGVCTQATCEDCEPAGVYQGPGTRCEDVTCSLPCTDCYKDCAALHELVAATASCFGAPEADVTQFFEWTDSGVEYKIYVLTGRTYGYPLRACSAGAVCVSNAKDPVTGEERTFVYPTTLVASANGCPESIVLGTPSQEDFGICVFGTWYGCNDGTGNCMNVTPATPAITFSCSDLPCVDDGDCPPGVGSGYCIDGFCEPDAPP